MTNAAFPAKGKIRDCGVLSSALAEPESTDRGKKKKKIKTGKNTASRQQDAHGPEKDDWLDPGNGEERRGRRYFRSQLCSDRKIPVLKHRETFCCSLP